jgi:hypothetical protein
MQLTCEVCKENEAIGVASSCLGPMSNAYCKRCLEHQAEPLWMFECTLEEVGEEVAEWVKQLTTYIDGTYVTWDEFANARRNDGGDTI